MRPACGRRRFEATRTQLASPDWAMEPSYATAVAPRAGGAYWGVSSHGGGQEGRYDRETRTAPWWTSSRADMGSQCPQAWASGAASVPPAKREWALDSGALGPHGERRRARRGRARCHPSCAGGSGHLSQLPPPPSPPRRRSSRLEPPPHTCHHRSQDDNAMDNSPTALFDSYEQDFK